MKDDVNDVPQYDVTGKLETTSPQRGSTGAKKSAAKQNGSGRPETKDSKKKPACKSAALTPVNPAPDAGKMRTHLEELVKGARQDYGDALVEIAYDVLGNGDVKRARLFGLDELDAAVKFAVEKNKRCNLYAGATLKKPDTPRNCRTSGEHSLLATLMPAESDKKTEVVRAAFAELLGEPALTVTTGTVPELRQQFWARLAEPCADMAIFEVFIEAAGALAVAAKEDYANVILNLPGAVSVIAKHILRVSWVPQPRLAVAAALQVVATAAGHRYKTPTHSKISHNSLMIAGTADGKGGPMAAAKAMLAAPGLSNRIGPRPVSDIALYLYCKSHPFTLLMINEFGDVLAADNARNAPPHAINLNAAYKMVWDDDTIPVPKAAGREHMVLDNPFVSLMAASTPEKFFNAFGHRHVEDGLMNRMLLFSAPSGMPFNKEKHDVREVPFEITELIQNLAIGSEGQALRDTEGMLAFGDAPAKSVEWGTGAETAFDAYRENRRAPLSVRCAHNAVKVATILAISEKPDEPRVELRHMELGIQLAETSLEDMKRGYEDHAPDSRSAELQDKILARVRREPGGMMSRRDLFGTLRKSFDEKRSFDGLVDLLLGSGALEPCEVKQKSGPPKKMLRAVETGAA